MESETPPEDTAVHRPGQGEPVIGDLRREHWMVPVHGLTPTDPDGIAQAMARRDGTVILRLTCGDSRTTVRLDVSRAAQLSTGIWEAAGAGQQLTAYLGDDQPPPKCTPRDRSPSTRRRLPPVNKDAAMDATRTIGRHLRRIRHARDKSLRVISGLAGMSRSTLHRVEGGQRELTLSEIVALANALQIDPAKLTRLAIPVSDNGCGH